MDRLAQWLSDRFWEGDRWVVLELWQGLPEQPQCFMEYAEAVDHCRKVGAGGRFYRIRVLGTLLKELNGKTRIDGRDVDKRRLREVIQNYPLRLFEQPPGWEVELLQGNYYPVIWEKVTQPLLAVRRYVILKKLLGGQFRVLNCKDEFSQIILALKDYAAELQKEKGELLVVGEFLEQPVDYRDGALYDTNITVTIYRVSWRSGPMPGVIQVHDPAVPVIRAFPMFLRYYVRRRTLFFFDGGLKRIRPGDEPDPIDLEWFDFRMQVMG